MNEINFFAVLAAAFAAFVASLIWYFIFGKALAKSSIAFAEQKPEAWKMFVVVAQSLVLATVLAYIIGRTRADTLLGAVWVAVVLWIGLSAVQWLGSILWEKVPIKVAAIHAGDWLTKLVLIAAIVGIWH